MPRPRSLRIDIYSCVSFCSLTSNWYSEISLRIELVSWGAEVRNSAGIWRRLLNSEIFLLCWTLAEDLSFWMWQEIMWLIAPSCSYGKGRINPLCGHENNLCTSKARMIYSKTAYVFCNIMLLVATEMHSLKVLDFFVLVSSLRSNSFFPFEARCQVP